MFYDKVKFGFCAFIWEEIMDFVEINFGAKINKYRLNKLDKTIFALKAKVIRRPLIIVSRILTVTSY